MSAVVEAWLTGLIQHNYSQEYITILCNTADSYGKTAIYYAVGSCEWNVVHRLLHFGARANSSGSFQDPVEDDFIVAIARANKVDLLRLVMQQIVTPAEKRYCVKSSRSGIWIAVWSMAKLAIPITPIYTGLPHCRFLLPCAWLLDACAEDGETAPINRTHLSFRALTAYISMNTGAKARSRFCVKPDHQERVLLQLEERLFCANEVDAALQRRCTDHAPCLPEESVMQAVIFSPPPVVCPFNQKACGTFYDFCYHAKTCGECGGMAGEEQKLLACSVCKTAHYCDWQCPKKNWGKQHKAECDILQHQSQSVANWCSQIATCMAVWNHVGATPQEIMDKNTRAIENGEQPEELKTFITNMNKTAGKWQKCNLVSGMASVASNMGWL